MFHCLVCGALTITCDLQDINTLKLVTSDDLSAGTIQEISHLPFLQPHTLREHTDTQTDIQTDQHTHTQHARHMHLYSRLPSRWYVYFIAPVVQDLPHLSVDQQTPGKHHLTVIAGRELVVRRGCLHGKGQ